MFCSWLVGEAFSSLLKALTPQLGYILQGFATDTNIRCVHSVFLFVAEEVEAEEKNHNSAALGARWCAKTYSAVWAL